MVHQVKRIGGKSHRKTLANLKYFSQRDIPILPARPLNDPHARVSKFGWRRIRECCSVEPMIGSPLIGWKRHRSAKVLRAPVARNVRSTRRRQKSSALQPRDAAKLPSSECGTDDCSVVAQNWQPI